MRKTFRGLIRRERSQADEAVAALAPAPTTVAVEEQTARVTPASPSVTTTTEAANDKISDDLWSRAYQALSEREPELLEDYERHIDALQGAAVSSTDASSEVARRTLLSSPKSVREVVQALQDERERNQWTFSVRSKGHKVRDQLEKLVKLLALADGVVKQAASAQPYAALAWSAVSIFLPVR